MDKRAPGHWSHWSPLQWATIAAKNPPLFIRKNGKRPAATIFYNGVYIYDPLLLLLPLFSLFFNWIQWHSWGLSALCLPLLLLVADIADFFHTHKEGGGRGNTLLIINKKSWRKKEDGPYMYTLSAVYTWWPVRKQDFFTLCDDQQISFYCARVPFHSRLSTGIYKDSHQTFYWK